MTRFERSKRLRECYRLIAQEINHHISNGSEWIYTERDGDDSPEDVVDLRFKVLRQVSDELAKRGGTP